MNRQVRILLKKREVKLFLRSELKGAQNTKNKFFQFEKMFNSKKNGIGLTFLLALFNELWQKNWKRRHWAGIAIVAYLIVNRFTQ